MDHNNNSPSAKEAKEGEPLSRKKRKPLMEKKRRARINSSLEELKKLVLDATRRDSARYSKLEKADILELTVKHLREVQSSNMTVAVSQDPNVASKFKTGYRECISEVTRYLLAIDSISDDVRSRLLSHLSSCQQRLEPTKHNYNGLLQVTDVYGVDRRSHRDQTTMCSFTPPNAVGRTFGYSAPRLSLSPVSDKSTADDYRDISSCGSEPVRQSPSTSSSYSPSGDSHLPSEHYAYFDKVAYVERRSSKSGSFLRLMAAPDSFFNHLHIDHYQKANIPTKCESNFTFPDPHTATSQVRVPFKDGNDYSFNFPGHSSDPPTKWKMCIKTEGGSMARNSSTQWEVQKTGSGNVGPEQQVVWRPW